MMEHKILLVDDDRDLLEMLCSIFRRAGYTDLVTASSGQEALQIWREQQPALIILDVMMPGMDGFEVLREIRRTSRVPVLMLTARGEAEDRIEGLEIGADGLSSQALFAKGAAAPGGGHSPSDLPGAQPEGGTGSLHGGLGESRSMEGRRTDAINAKELQLFEKLYENAGRIVTTGILCETICGEFWQGYESTLSHHIRHLREKVEENPSRPVSLVTAKGLGYRLKSEGGETVTRCSGFFRRYIFSTVGILALFLVVNLLLVLTVLTAGYMSGTDNGLSVRRYPAM